MPTLASSALATLLATTSYLFSLCNTNPNPPPAVENRPKSDRISFVTGTPLVTFARRAALTSGLYHALLALYYPNLTSSTTGPQFATGKKPLVCPHPSNLSSSLSTWSPLTITCLISMFLGASFRLSAYGGLGRFFTFSLAAPEQLITHGIYRFIQHPAYIGQMLAMVPALGMALTWHGGVGCFVDRDVVQMLYGWSGVVSGVLLAGVVRMMAVRVRDEERMLREKFGDEWIDWNRRTGRVIPGGF